MAIKYAGDSALRYLKTKLMALINAAKSAADTAQTTANSAKTAASTAQSTANSAVSAANANTSALGNKVDKVSGKGLSTNDYTAAEKTKLAGIATGANKYALPTATSGTPGGVRLSDSVLTESGVDGGFAATPYAVKRAYDLANDAKGEADTNTANIEAEAQRATNAEKACGKLTATRLNSGAVETYTCGPSGTGVVYVSRGGQGVAYTALVDYWNGISVLSSVCTSGRAPTVTASGHVVTVKNNASFAVQVVFITQ